MNTQPVIRLRHAWLLCVPLMLATQAAQAQEQFVDLRSNGGYTSARLADDVTQVDLAEQTQGACCFNRTWGYDLTNRELWTNGGCGGRFKVTRTYAQGNGNNSSNNAGAAVAAVAAIAGIALLANHNKHDDDRRPDYPDYGNGGGGGRGGEIRVNGNLCLDVSKGNFRHGNALQVFACNGTDSQRFRVGRGGEIRVRDFCLDVERGDPRDGARVVLWSCSGAPSQSWTTRGGQIVSQLSGKCLDVVDGQIRQGQPAMVWQCNRSPSQRWWW